MEAIEYNPACWICRKLAGKGSAGVDEDKLCVDHLRSEYLRLRDQLQEIQEVQDAVMSEKCAGDEVHCTCVPVLRGEISRLNDECIKAKDYMVSLSATVTSMANENAALSEKLARLVEAAEKHLDNQNAVTFLKLSEAIAAAKE